jgi:hypothetical protein
VVCAFAAVNDNARASVKQICFIGMLCEITRYVKKQYGAIADEVWKTCLLLATCLTPYDPAEVIKQEG